jgi:formamidopyrimidine-DNA glycosylase
VPELPDVDTVVRSLAPYLVGRTILRAKFFSKLVTRGGLSETAKAVKGRTITGIRRHGKQIFLELDRGLLYVHLGMTGKLLWNGAPGPYSCAILDLDKGKLVYDDVRQFGRFDFYETLPAALARRGPDALDIAFDEFYTRLKGRRGQIKALLMNQAFLSGLGNIYVDELLFRARLHPQTPISGISRKRAQVLHQQLGELLQLAIAHRGSSISDYVDAAGELGAFQDLHRVYGRTGCPCMVCGTTVQRIVIAQRGTHFCPRCQRL